MSRGILLLAWGKRGYGFMAYNLAVSLKHHSPGIPIHGGLIVRTSGVITGLTTRRSFQQLRAASNISESAIRLMSFTGYLTRPLKTRYRLSSCVTDGEVANPMSFI